MRRHGLIAAGPWISSRASARQWPLLPLIIAGLIMAGCGTHVTPRDWKAVGLPADYAFAESAEGVTVAAEPWTNSQDVQGVFGRNLLDRKIVPVRLVIFNQGTTALRFSSTQVKLCCGDAPPLSVLPTSDVSARSQDSQATAATIQLMTVGYGFAVASAVAHATENANRKASVAARSSSMSLVFLEPGEAMAGFLFFEGSPGDFERWNQEPGARLQILRLPRSDGPPLAFSIKVSFHIPKEVSP
jgi:hypothetical protein